MKQIIFSKKTFNKFADNRRWNIRYAICGFKTVYLFYGKSAEGYSAPPVLIQDHDFIYK